MVRNPEEYDKVIRLRRLFIKVAQPELGLKFILPRPSNPNEFRLAVIRALDALEDQIRCHLSSLERQGDLIPPPRDLMASYEKKASVPITTGEAARRLGVSIPTVRKMINEGILKSIKTAGGKNLILFDALRE
jgi:excisionase family DNA binding protein